jgi:hypothetical protein
MSSALFCLGCSLTSGLVGAIVDSLFALATDRWVLHVSIVGIDGSVLDNGGVDASRACGFAGGWCSSRALMGSFRVDDGEP